MDIADAAAVPREVYTTVRIRRDARDFLAWVSELPVHAQWIEAVGYGGEPSLGSALQHVLSVASDHLVDAEGDRIDYRPAPQRKVGRPKVIEEKDWPIGEHRWFAVPARSSRKVSYSVIDRARLRTGYHLVHVDKDGREGAEQGYFERHPLTGEMRSNRVWTCLRRMA